MNSTQTSPGEEYIVAVPFRDSFNYDKRFEVGDDVSSFDPERLAKLVKSGAVVGPDSQQQEPEQQKQLSKDNQAALSEDVLKLIASAVSSAVSEATAPLVAQIESLKTKEAPAQEEPKQEAPKLTQAQQKAKDKEQAKAEKSAETEESK